MSWNDFFNAWFVAANATLITKDIVVTEPIAAAAIAGAMSGVVLKWEHDGIDVPQVFIARAVGMNREANRSM